MDRHETKSMVLARIPDVGVAEHQGSRAELPTSSGRVIGQALSFKLLAVAVLVLVVTATIPYALWRNGRATAPSTTADASTTTATAWQAGSPGSSAGTAPVWVAPAVAAVPAAAPSPVKSLLTPEVVPQPKVASDSPVPASPDASQMSAWPNPNHQIASPEAGGEAPRASMNQAMAIRPEYGRNNTYDGTRSSIH